MPYTFTDQFADRYSGQAGGVGGNTADPSVQAYYDLINGIKSGSTPMTFGGTPMSPTAMQRGGAQSPWESAKTTAAGMPTISLGQLSRGTANVGGFRPGDVGYTPYDPTPPTPLTGTAAAGPSMGSAPGNGQFDINNWKDPGYDFRLGEGLKLLQGSAAARGALMSGATLRDITNYGQNAASQEYANAYGRYASDRAFNYGADSNDRDFFYRAMTGDRDYNADTLRFLAQLGLAGTNGTASSNVRLGESQSDLAQALGLIQSAGTMGQSNNVMGTLQEALRQLMGNRDARSVEDLIANRIYGN